MEDKELMELAAKANGGEIATGRWNGACLHIYTGKKSYTWNPLDDDGDALRLAVNLGLDILQYQEPDEVNSVEVIANDDRFGDFKPWASEPLLKDPCAATRRAIVRAAANVGKVMP